MSERSAVAKSQDLSESVVTLPTQADAWTRSSTLECKTTHTPHQRKKKKKNPAVCSRPPFLPPPPFPFHADSRIFCSLSFLPSDVFFPLACHASSFLTFPARLSLWSVVQHAPPPPPVQEDQMSLKRFKGPQVLLSESFSLR